MSLTALAALDSQMDNIDVLRNSHSPDDSTAKISAYYSLVFPNITFYLQTLTVTIGRRCIPNASTSAGDNSPVDVDLGPLKSVSRLHAKIEYEEDEERFVLVVVGRNGAWVDGVWSGSGSRVPLGERSQIQIASRTFHFVLPPPPAPEDSPSPSSNSSVQRARSPSVDITSISPPSSLPSNSPPPVSVPVPPPKTPDPQLPNTNSISRAKNAPKKRKKSDLPVPKPEVMPPKPQFTYAQLCYRAIKAMGGKATLQDICSWMMENYDWYRYNEGAGWEVSYLISDIAPNSPNGSPAFQNSVRHNLSSGRAFKKMERSSGERGKGFYWSVDEQYEHTFEEQEARSQAASSSTGGKDGKGRKKEKATPLEPALKRSVKGDIKGITLPPPLTTTPLFKSSNSSIPQANPLTTAPLASPFTTAPIIKTEPLTAPKLTSTVHPALGAPSPYAAPALASTPSSDSACAASNAASAPFSALPASVCLPIIVGPVPPSHPSSSNPEQAQPIILHNNTLILSPTIFSHLSPEQLKELEALGAQKALEILQGHIVRYLKEKMTRGRGRTKRARGGRGGTPGSRDNKAPPPGGPFTTTPLPSRTPQPVTVPGFGSAQTQAPAAHPPTAESASVSVAEKPPVPVPITSSAPPPRSESPIIVVDDIDSADEGPAMKKRRIDVVC
ncbi:hypothetical protein EDB19DRAFT_1902167 [Suillus lakei]|nr:hypothetical protein EDB19DRAFT_1902167 [Suillus lakei]